MSEKVGSAGNKVTASAGKKVSTTAVRSETVSDKKLTDITDIGIFIEFNNKVVQIPVNPEKFTVNTQGDNETENIITLGEIVIPKYKKLSEISWSSFFPYKSWHPSVRTKGSFKSAKFYLDFLEKIRNKRKPCRLTVTGIGFDENVVIESFNYYHQAGDHEDTYYDIIFKKYETYGISVIPKKTTKKKANPLTTGDETTSPKEITIGCDVILNGRVHYNSYGAKPGKTFKNYKGKISHINKKGSHPYHVTTPSGGWLGWVTKESVVLG